MSDERTHHHIKTHKRNEGEATTQGCLPATQWPGYLTKQNYFLTILVSFQNNNKVLTNFTKWIRFFLSSFLQLHNSLCSCDTLIRIFFSPDLRGYWKKLLPKKRVFKQKSWLQTQLTELSNFVCNQDYFFWKPFFGIVTYLCCQPKPFEP